ncbi:MAG: hypothetical protein GX904_04225 [Acholeplasmataceae bacterium]|nr:hypothetical protein [Acholeplasmataceae bacterium]
MKNYWLLLKADLKRLYQMRVFMLVVIVSFVLGVATGLFPFLNPANALYVSVFILPVLIFSFSLQFEINNQEGLPKTDRPISAAVFLLSKITSAVLIQLIPLLFIIIALVFIRGHKANYPALVGVYLLGILNHIVIGLSLSIISKSYRILPLSYLVYLLVFCVPPIFFSNGLLPLKLQYFLVFSPAYLSGVLIDNLLAANIYSPLWLLLLSVFLQIAYTVLLSLFVINPFFKAYISKNLIETE